MRPVRRRFSLCLLVCVVGGLVAWAHPAGPAPPARSGPPRTAPTPISGTPPTGADRGLDRPPDRRELLEADLAGMLRTYAWRDARWGVLVVSLENGDTLFARNADQPLAPASNLKILTTSTALRRLGPDYRFRSYLLTRAPIHDGVLHGDLVLYGTGDPGISQRFHRSRTEIFETLVQELRAQGVREVRGDLVADASFFPGPLRPEGWDPADLNDHFAPGISALSFNENVVSFRLEPGARAGAPPTVHTLPADADLPLVNRGVTVSTAPRPLVSITRESPLDPFVISGAIQRGGRDVWRQMTVQEPARFAASVFSAVMEDAGIGLTGRVRRIERPSESLLPPEDVTAPTVRRGRRVTRILATHVSRPLRDYVEIVNKESNNLFAELIFRALGREDSGIGSSEAAARTVQRTLAEMGVGTEGLKQFDGSGLSEGNRVSPATLVDLFLKSAGTPLWSEFWNSLPEAGRRRELSRMYRTAAAGNLRAKTGTIARVSALSGVVRSADGEALAFSILVNGTPSTWRAKRVENAIGARLASFSRGR